MSDRSTAIPSRWRQLGPGLLFAASAVGVSHLVQSTRAGAMFGMAMLGVILLANAVKYPAFRYAPAYTADTGYTLIESFRRQGKGFLAIFTVVFFLAVFISQAAVTLVTAGLLKAGLGIDMSSSSLAVIILIGTAALLHLGRYHWLDLIIKVLMIVLFVCTLVAVALVIPYIDFTGGRWTPRTFDMPTILFMAALAGWMPAPLDSAVMQSLWTAAKSDDQSRDIPANEARFDFHVGYIGCVVMAVCFLLLGAGVMHGSEEQFADSAGGFAAQIIALYTRTLGDWSWPIIATAAVATMYSTVLTALDGFARAVPVIFARWQGPEVRGENKASGRAYGLSLLLVAAGASIVVTLLLSTFKILVMVATTLSFMTAPLIAFLIHRAINSEEVSDEVRPRGILYAWSFAGVVLLIGFALLYAYLLITA